MPGKINKKTIKQEEKMRKFWIVLLSLTLIVAFTMPVFAADVKFSGSYYVQGVYDNNRSLRDAKDLPGTGANGGSTAFIAQRLRVATDFKVAEGLTLVTRFDALEKKWGDHTWTGTASGNYDTVNRPSSGNSLSRVQENIEFERAYVDFTTGIGRFLIGYQNFIAFGTTLLDTHVARPGIKYMLPLGNTTLVLAMEQIKEGTSTPTVSPTNQGTVTDGDKTAYDIAVVQKFQGGDAGVLVQYLAGKDARAASSYQTKAYIIDPYVKATFGPVFVEAEAYYGGGYLQKFESGVGDVKISTYGAYVHALGNFGPAYVGGKFMLMKGDKPDTLDKKEGGLASTLSMGQIASPCLILWNDETSTWMNGLPGGVANFPDNVWLYGLYGGIKPMPKLDVSLGAFYATADQQPAGYSSKKYGTEVDLIAKFKIYDNLEYMFGAGYLFAGDYFKTTTPNVDVKNDYMITHKLTLTF
jgi:hypothetical protein